MIEPDAPLTELFPRLGFLEGAYAIFMRPTEKFEGVASPEGAELLRRHLIYLLNLEDEGVLLLAGPLDLNPVRIEGMMVVKAGSREEAEQIAAGEPYGAEGWRVNEVKAFQINEGTLVSEARTALA